MRTPFVHFVALLGCMPFVLPTACASPARTDPARSEPGRSLFDGKSLEGWVTKGGRYDGNALWTVEDGAITGRENEKGEGGLIYTARPYRNFVFRCDAKVEWPFDSGIFLRMAQKQKGAQVTIDWREGGEVGGIYSDGWLQHNPTGVAKFKKDEWNTFEVRCMGDDLKISARINGEALVDFRLPEASEDYAATGLIGLQVHGGGAKAKKAQFKNISIVELQDADSELFERDPGGAMTTTAKGLAAGWVRLFDGKTLDGWRLHGGATGARVEDGAIVFPVAGTSEYLRTERADYKDFVLRLDFKIARGANSGVFLRADPAGGNPAYSGCEIQILDDFFWEQDTKSKLEEWQFTGSLYGAVAPSWKHALNPLGEWNNYEILYQGSRIRTLLNGHLLYDVDTKKLEVDKPFSQRAAQGFLGLQRHASDKAQTGDYAWFKNIFVKELR